MVARMVGMVLVLVLSVVGLSGCADPASAGMTGTNAQADASSGQGGQGGAGSGDSPASSPPTDSLIVSGSVVQEGQMAPDFAYTTVNGVNGSLSDHRDTVVLLNLWASWCGPCVVEMPDIARLKADYPDLEVLAVNVSDDPVDAREFIAAAGYDFSWVLDEQKTIGALYPTDGIPYTVIINREGVVASIFLGSPRDAYATYELALKQAGL